MCRLAHRDPGRRSARRRRSGARAGLLFATTPGRLPKNVVPVHYAIQLEPNLESLTLAGLALVDIEVREPTASGAQRGG